MRRCDWSAGAVSDFERNAAARPAPADMPRSSGAAPTAERSGSEPRMICDQASAAAAMVSIAAKNLVHSFILVLLSERAFGTVAAAASTVKTKPRPSRRAGSFFWIPGQARPRIAARGDKLLARRLLLHDDQHRRGEEDRGVGAGDEADDEREGEILERLPSPEVDGDQREDGGERGVDRTRE